jgi:hypothetical protein
MANSFLLKHKLASGIVMLNVTSAKERALKTERRIHAIKERVRAARRTLPFKVIPLTMLICSSVMWINPFPPKDGVSLALSPCNVMTGTQFDHNKHCQL